MQFTPAATAVFAVTILASLYGLYVDRSFIGKFMLRPWSFIYERRWFTVITSGFLHADLMHLAFNMFTFYYFAFKAEEYLGAGGFLVMYLGSMVLADITSILKNKDDYGYASLGASGAISGALFSCILFEPKSSMGIMLFPFPIPAPVFAILYLAFCYYAGRKQYDLINHEAHFWGAVAGIIITAAIKPESITLFFNQLSF